MQTEDIDLIDSFTACEIDLEPVGHYVLRSIVPAFAVAPWTTIVAIDRSRSGKAAARTSARSGGDCPVSRKGHVESARRRNQQLAIAIAIFFLR